MNDGTQHLVTAMDRLGRDDITGCDESLDALGDQLSAMIEKWNQIIKAHGEQQASEQQVTDTATNDKTSPTPAKQE